MQRFWDKVAIGQPNECWPWTRAKTRDGYGSFGAYKGISVLAHRAAWEIQNGPIPDGMYVLHRCDNPPCVNPLHLFLGTQADNVADCSKKGRRNQSRWKKLSPEKRQEIRDLYATGSYSLAALGRKYGVSYQTIRSHL
jgi:hypothetical protein